MNGKTFTFFDSIILFYIFFFSLSSRRVHQQVINVHISRKNDIELSLQSMCPFETIFVTEKLTM